MSCIYRRVAYDRSSELSMGSSEIVRWTGVEKHNMSDMVRYFLFDFCDFQHKCRICPLFSSAANPEMKTPVARRSPEKMTKTNGEK